MRRRLEVQGFTGLSDQDINQIEPWTRFTPTLNAAITALGTLLGSPRILLLLAFLMGLGAVFPMHPFDWLYNKTLRLLTHTKPLPHSGPRRRFVFALACWWLLVTAFLFRSGRFGAAFVAGMVMTALALLLAIANICVVSELLHRLFGTPGIKR